MSFHCNNGNNRRCQHEHGGFLNRLKQARRAALYLQLAIASRLLEKLSGDVTHHGGPTCVVDVVWFRFRQRRRCGTASTVPMVWFLSGDDVMVDFR